MALMLHPSAKTTADADPPCMDEIVHRVHLGNAAAGCSARYLRKRRITHVVNCTLDKDFAFAAWEEEGKALRIPVQDQSNDNWPSKLRVLLPGAVEFITRALEADPKHQVLIHCGQGTSRSVTVVLAFLIMTASWSDNKGENNNNNDSVPFLTEQEYVEKSGRGQEFSGVGTRPDEKDNGCTNATATTITCTRVRAALRYVCSRRPAASPYTHPNPGFLRECLLPLERRTLANSRDHHSTCGGVEGDGSRRY